MTYAITASEIQKAFGDNRVLDGTDLSIGTGSVFALLGINGAGKTTLVNILTTLTRPDAGSATVVGHDLLGDPEAVRRSISLTGQSAAVDDLLTAEENLQLLARLYRLSRRDAAARAAQLLDEFNLGSAARRRVATYSGGMRRRLDLALGMISRPAIAFLDEPTTGLDPLSREHVWSVIRQLTTEGTTVFLTTQYLEEADRLASTIAFLHGGRIVASGPATKLKSLVAGEIAHVELPDCDSARRAVAVVGGSVAVDHRFVDVATDGSAEHVRWLLGELADAGIPAQRIELHRPTLDDVFFSLTSSTREEVAA